MKFYQAEATIYPMSNNVGQILEDLAPGLYSIDINPMGGISFPIETLPKVPDFTYGNVEGKAEFFVNRFLSLGRSMGIWLNGVKGTGKTYQSNATVRAAVAHGLPVFRVSQALSGETLKEIVKVVGKPMVIFIDEFDKLYGTGLSDESNSSEDISNEKQGNLLNFLDGGNTIPVMTIITSNDETKVSSFIRGRAGRVRYREEYDYLEDEAVMAISRHLYPEIANETLVYLSRGMSWTMDSLRVVLEEINAFPEMRASDVLSRLNLDYKSKQFTWNVNFNGVDLGRLFSSYSGVEILRYDEVLSRDLSDINIIAPECPEGWINTRKTEDYPGMSKLFRPKYPGNQGDDNRKDSISQVVDRDTGKVTLVFKGGMTFVLTPTLHKSLSYNSYFEQGEAF